MKGSRMQRMLIAGAVLGLSALILVAGASAARSQAGLDRSYGQEGVASAYLPPPPARYLTATQFASAPDGSAYILGAFSSCQVDCSTTLILYRWTAQGGLDGSFGGGSVQVTIGPSVPGSTAEGVALAVDSAGRPVISRIESGALVVRRYSSTGTLDPSFGVGGSISIPCAECARGGVWLVPAAKERVLVETQATLPAVQGGIGSRLGGQVSLTRLTPGGWPERSFGGGTVTVGLGARAYPGKAAVTPRGAVLFGSTDCCSGNGPYLTRISARGRIDPRFARTARRTLTRLAKQGETNEIAAVLPRANGRIDLVGTNLIGGGFDLRLKADGEPARFGKKGLKRLPFQVEAAALGADGAIFAVGNHDTGPYSAFRLFGDGRVDPAFGKIGIVVPSSGSRFTLGTPTRGKVLVYDRGDHECRQGCAATPGIARFNETSGKG
jgi:hypothetical protein